VDERDTTDLGRAAAAGDHVAFGELYRRHARAVGTTVASRLSGTDDRADAVQETFVKAWQRLDSLRDPEQFLPWLYAIARNTATTYGRSKTRHRADELTDTTPVASADASPDDLASAAHLLDAARRAGARLSQRDATVLSMAIDFEFGLAEIAAALGVTENNAGVILHRARQRLRKELDAAGALAVDDSSVMTRPPRRHDDGPEVEGFELDRGMDPVMDEQRDAGERLMDKVRAFAAALEGDERALFATLVAPGISSAFSDDESEDEVEGFQMDEWEPRPVPAALIDLLRTTEVDLTDL
jgi:RNA polymerase sigma factor (sigma-70 family)